MDGEILGNLAYLDLILRLFAALASWRFKY